MPDEAKQATSLECFKEKLATKREHRKHFNTGTRRGNILQARLRLQCSDLNDDKFHIGLSEYPNCACGADREDVEHFLMVCPLYDNIRQTLIYELSHICDYKPSVHEMLWGTPEETVDSFETRKIFKSVQKLIITSERFG